MKRLLFVLLFVGALAMIPLSSPRAYTCNGYCSPEGCGTDCPGTGTCPIHNVCCKVCPTPSPTRTPTPRPTNTPTPTQPACTCNPALKPTDCATRPGCVSGMCFPVCNYSTCPPTGTWACTSEEEPCTTNCTNANAWSAWFCNPDNTDTRYCTLPSCLDIAQARVPCGGGGGTPGPTPTPPGGATPTPIPTPTPATTVQGRIAYDSDHNGYFDGINTSNIENPANIPPDCTAESYYQLSGLSINYSGPLSGSINYHTGCNGGGPYYSKILTSFGYYDLTPVLPAGYYLVAIGGDAGLCTLVGNSAHCNIALPDQWYNVWFLIDNVPPTCVSWTSEQIQGQEHVNSCTQAKYTAVPRDLECITSNSTVTLHLSSYRANQMSFANRPIAEVCSDVADANFSTPETYATTKTWALSAGYGEKKTCVRFTNVGGSSKCGAMIEYNVSTIKARAVSVDPTNTSCTTIRAGGTGGIDGSNFLFSAGSPSHPTPTPLQQSGNTYVWFNNAVPGGPYTIYATPSPAPAYVPARYCWQRTTAPTTGETQSADLPSGDTLTWDIGFTRPGPWSQAAGGDVYASGTLQSFVPVGTSPRAFILDADGTTSPGVATYGTNYDFDDAVGQGETWVSSKNWLVQDTASNADFYQIMFQQFGGEPATWDYINPVSPIGKPASRATPYYVKGDMTTSGSWSVGAGQTIIFIVDGALMINGPITVSAGGFAAFIVNGNITILTSVATIQGIYITSPAGTFATGASATAFHGTGTFVAGNFSLQRNVDTQNPTTPSETFTYNPQLLITMPEAMKKLSVSWQEVAP